MNTVRSILVASAVALCTQSALGDTALDPARGAVLPISEMGKLVSQCSRSAPTHVDGEWTPSPDQIRELEATLPNALDEAVRDMRREHGFGGWFKVSDPSGFYRQYGGLLIAGRRIIYVNAFPHEDVDFEGTDMPSNLRPDWRHEAFIVCDGGQNFFGVEYDPASKVFSNFSFNGIG